MNDTSCRVARRAHRCANSSHLHADAATLVRLHARERTYLRRPRPRSAGHAMVHKGRMPVDPTTEEFERVPELSQLDANDIAGMLRLRDQRVREEWVEILETEIIRERLSDCYKREGVNYRENCRHLALAYMDRLRRGGIRSWKLAKEDVRAADTTATSTE